MITLNINIIQRQLEENLEPQWEKHIIPLKSVNKDQNDWKFNLEWIQQIEFNNSTNFFQIRQQRRTNNIPDRTQLTITCKQPTFTII
ncbi:unnamed protein product [Ambrosiozyma monospora]|uniref:Unnamed protein product n=1 Tax=Ambrosiozyma monospora TaxID=43982 RepID=A0A9W6T2H4_AMBMO|nr:unnamed protein product [Ambrosiozyma monospora]